MIRLVGIVLVIWGLIVQPLMAGMPTKMAKNSTHIGVALDVGMSVHAEGHVSHHVQKVSEATKAACHEGAIDGGSSSGTCDNCEFSCVSGVACVSLCVLSGAAVNRELMVVPESQITIVISAKTTRFGFDFFSRIYHPPRLS